MLRVLLLILLLLSPAWARTPAEVVKEVYSFHAANLDQRETVTRFSHCFDPEFREVFLRALDRKPGGDGAFVDMDYFFWSQDGGHRFAVADTVISDGGAEVLLKTWQGPYRGGPGQPVPEKPNFRIHLVKLGDGYRIRDVERLPVPVSYPDGRVEWLQGGRALPHLRMISEGKWPGD
ncbi:MAG: hypothetical protein HY319_03000 [Armatimonadetes bacterium]|nr:hypothetical protein [Armatimonadota bacterium]